MTFLAIVFQDVRFSLRLLRKSPGFAITAILTLALGIGANAVVFGVLNGLILHPLKLPEVESLYAIQHGDRNGCSESYPDYLDLRDRNRSFEDLAAYTYMPAALDMGKNSARVTLVEASGNYFDALKLQPYLGRFFHASDEHGANSAPYIVLSYEFWNSQFQGDRGIIGQTVQVNKHPFTLIGVAPPEFHGTLVFFYADLFLPMVNQEQVNGENYLGARRETSIFMTMGHLKAGVTLPQAIADLNSIGSWLGTTYPKEAGQRSFTLARPGLNGDFLGRPMQAFMTALLLLSGMILLAACANLGSLFAARAAERSREVALRLALGSSRRRILRQLFTEALILSLAGGAVGLLTGFMLLRGLNRWQPFPKYPVHVAAAPDANVILFALLLTIVSGFLFSAVPVRQMMRVSAYEMVKSGSMDRSRRRITLRDVLVVAQISICAILVTSSLVALRGMMKSLHVDFGFTPQEVMLADTDLATGQYKGDTALAMQKRMVETLQAIPGVDSVAAADGVPLSASVNDSNVFTETATDLTPAKAIAHASVYRITPDYFRAAGTTMLAGRTFTWHDDKDSPRVAVINPAFARKVFGSVENAVGGSYKMPEAATPAGTRIQVVGITEQGKYGSLTEDPKPAMFLPLVQSPSTQTWLVVRSKRDSQQLGPDIRNALRSLDKGLPFYVQPWFKEMDYALFGPRMATISLGVMGGIGAMLVLTGIFGVTAYSVSKRMRELGLRVALGAQRKDVLRAALGRAFKLLAFGSVAGLVLGILASQVLSFVIYQATPRDPLVLGGVVLAMALLGLAASWIPARRALAVDPLRLLKED
jgi:predicted permease